MHDLIPENISSISIITVRSISIFSVKFFTLLKHNWMRLFVSIWSIIKCRNQVPACLPIAYPFFSFFFQVSYNEYTVAILSFFLPLSNTAINAIYRHTCNVAKIKHVHIKIGLFWFKFLLSFDIFHLPRQKSNKFSKMSYLPWAKYTHPVTTTTKSIMFQIFLRYAPLCKTNPKATIFSKASTKKITTK